MFVLLVEPYAMIQLSNLLSAINQMDRNAIFCLLWLDLRQPLAELCGSIESRLKNTGVEDEVK